MRLRLYDVIKYLKRQGYAIDNTFVSYYSSIFSAYINCNLDPVSKNVLLAEDDLEVIDNTLSLRLKIQKGLGRQYQDNDDEDDLIASRNSFSSFQDENEEEKVPVKKGQPSATSQDSDDDPDLKKTRRRSQITQHYMAESTKQNPKTKERTVGYVIEKVA